MISASACLPMSPALCFSFSASVSLSSPCLYNSLFLPATSCLPFSVLFFPASLSLSSPCLPLSFLYLPPSSYLLFALLCLSSHGLPHFVFSLPFPLYSLPDSHSISRFSYHINYLSYCCLMWQVFFILSFKTIYSCFNWAPSILRSLTMLHWVILKLEIVLQSMFYH